MSIASSSDRRNRRIDGTFVASLVLALTVALVAVVAAPPAVSAATAPTVGGLIGEVTAQLNQERAARGASPLVPDPSIAAASQEWAEALVASQDLSHSGDGRAEIVAYGGRTGQIMRAWMKSPGHRNLVVDPNLGFAGVGVACDANGRMWAVVQFRRVNTRLGTLTSSATTPKVTPDSDGSTCDDRPMPESIRRLYLAYFLRSSDEGGLSFWVQMEASGWSLIRISDEFASSPEFKSRYGSLGNGEFVNLVYRNVMGREPDASGRNYWVKRLKSGLTRGELMLFFSDSAEFRTKSGIS